MAQNKNIRFYFLVIHVLWISMCSI